MSPIRMSRIESAIRVVLKYIEAFNRQDVAGMMQLLSDKCIFENPDPAPDGAVYSGKEALSRFWEGFFRQSPHARLERRLLALAIGVLCAGDMSGWTKQG